MFWNSVFAQALAGKLDPVSVVNEAVEDGVGECWIADHVMPAIDRHLAGDERRRVIEAILDDFEQVAGLLRGEGFRPPIIQDEQFDPAEAFEQLAISPVATRQGESTKEAWNTLVKDGDILPAGLLAESAGKPAFAGATQANDILPKNTFSMLSLNIRIIRLQEGGSRWFGALSTRGWSISLWMARTDAEHCCPPG